jgi:hypothetical protein
MDWNHTWQKCSWQGSDQLLLLFVPIGYPMWLPVVFVPTIFWKLFSCVQFYSFIRLNKTFFQIPNFFFNIWDCLRYGGWLRPCENFFLFCSLNIISCSHNLLFCSHKKDILFPQLIILFSQYNIIILFPQHIGQWSESRKCAMVWKFDLCNCLQVARVQWSEYGNLVMVWN